MQGGTYLFKLKSTNEIYIGSTACFRKRIEGHKQQFKGHCAGTLHKLTSNKQEDLI